MGCSLVHGAVIKVGDGSLELLEREAPRKRIEHDAGHVVVHAQGAQLHAEGVLW